MLRHHIDQVLGVLIIPYRSLHAISCVYLQSNRRMRDSKPEHSVARMQEELTAVRMREAEANLSMKELRKRVVVLETEWQVRSTRRLNSKTMQKPCQAKLFKIKNP